MACPLHTTPGGKSNEYLLTKHTHIKNEILKASLLVLFITINVCCKNNDIHLYDADLVPTLKVSHAFS